MKFMRSFKVLSISSTILITCLLATTAAAEPTAKFQDINGHWAQVNITKAAYKGYVDGYPEGTFKPEAAVSRAEFIKMLVAATNQEILVVNGEWYQSYINASTQSGIHRYDDFTNDINGEISRMEIIRLIVRATNTELQKTTVSLDDKALVYTATKKGLIQGLSGGSLGLDESTTRAQAVSVIERVLKLNDNELLPIDKSAVQMAEIAMTGTNFMTVLNRPAYKTFPIQYSVGDVGLGINQITVIDSDNPNTPFTIRDEGSPNRYIVQYQLSWDLSKLQQDIRVSDYFRISEKEWNDPIQLDGTEIVAYQESGETITHLRMSFTKEQLRAYIDNGGLYYFAGEQKVPLFY
ncbi:S-layer homology domain-containing protein [Paenibacillus periandrae]|uniref:S-layer homology domain-containing protein n=1 Tax=Paenibacillus periandrae TaxID=1761741 RepID=UPI001F09CAD7|nr:S-layer homology domain-containing protein [Paenibacillus periandrae]